MAVLDWVSVGALGAAAVVVTVAALRIRALNRIARERRLLWLALFFAGLAVAFTAESLGAVLFLTAGEAIARDRFDVHDVLFWCGHLGWLAGLGAAVAALGGPRRDRAHPVMATWLLAAAPVLFLLEGLVLVYLVVRTGLNHVRRTNLGSLEVALGFALLAAARLLPFVLRPEGPLPLGAPALAVSLTALAGAWVVAAVIPGRRK